MIPSKTTKENRPQKPRSNKLVTTKKQLDFMGDVVFRSGHCTPKFEKQWLVDDRMDDEFKIFPSENGDESFWDKLSISKGVNELLPEGDMEYLLEQLDAIKTAERRVLSGPRKSTKLLWWQRIKK